MGASAQPQTAFADYLDLLRVFDEREAEALIVGGQAVNFWAEAFAAEEPELQKCSPTVAPLDLPPQEYQGGTRARICSASNPAFSRRQAKPPPQTPHLCGEAPAGLATVAGSSRHFLRNACRSAADCLNSQN
jgi:hypothetical protein